MNEEETALCCQLRVLRGNKITSRQLVQNFPVSFTFGEKRCPGPDWYQFGQHCYETLKLTCLSLKGDLVSIGSMREQMWSPRQWSGGGDVCLSEWLIPA